MKPLRFLLAAALVMPMVAQTASAADPENTLLLDLKDGRVVKEEEKKDEKKA